MPDYKKLKEYDSEPVVCCAKCYSLKIKYEDSIDADYCADCGSTDTIELPIEEWENLYKQRHGHKFVEGKKDLRRSPIFKMPIKELKCKVYDSPHLNEIIHNMYPKFPGGLSKIDSVLLLFDKISKDNRLDDLRLQLINYT